jgi:hypothetical protein
MLESERLMSFSRPDGGSRGVSSVEKQAVRRKGATNVMIHPIRGERLTIEKPVMGLQ